MPPARPAATICPMSTDGWLIALSCLTGITPCDFIPTPDRSVNTSRCSCRGAFGTAVPAWRAGRRYREPPERARLQLRSCPAALHVCNVEREYVVTFAVMPTIALVIGRRSCRGCAQVESTRRERRTPGALRIGQAIEFALRPGFSRQRRGRKDRGHAGRRSRHLPPVRAELAYGRKLPSPNMRGACRFAQRVVDHDQIAGAGTNTLPSRGGVVFAADRLKAHARHTGRPYAGRRTAARSRSAAAFGESANQPALALERDKLAIEAAEARIQAETEQVRSSLLSSVSHDLKTPLAAIAGASSSLLESESFDEEMPTTFANGSPRRPRLNRLLENIPDVEARCGSRRSEQAMARAGGDRRLGFASHARTQLANHEIETRLPHDLPLIFVDGLLIEQIFVNLLEKRRALHACGDARHDRCRGRRRVAADCRVG